MKASSLFVWMWHCSDGGHICW